MRNRKLLTTALLTAFLVCLPVTSMTAQEEGAETNCTATPNMLQKDSGSPSLEIDVDASIGAVKNVEVEAESGLEVIEIGDKESTKVQVTLDTRQAASGTWLISIEGEGGRCTAAVTVEAA